MSLFITFTNGTQATPHFRSRLHLEAKLRNYVLLGWLTSEDAARYLATWQS